MPIVKVPTFPDAETADEIEIGSEAHGSINKTRTYQTTTVTKDGNMENRRPVQLQYPWHSPVQPDSPAQLYRRQIMREAVAAYHALNPQEKEELNADAKELGEPWSGYTLFISNFLKEAEMAHKLLSLTHLDTLEDDPIRGDILVADDTPEWKRLPKGTAGYVLTMGAADPAWAAPSGGAEDFLDLDDTPASYTDQANKILRVNATPNALIFGADISHLDDVDALTGQAGKLAVVKAADAGIEFTSTPKLTGLLLYGDLFSDRWLEQNGSTFIGIDVAGGDALAHSTGDEGYFNSAFGSGCMYAITSGYSNCGFGWGSLQVLTTGRCNSAFGRVSMYSNTTGIFCSAFGYNALLANVSGDINSGFGYQALALNVSGIGNTGMGYSAGMYQSDGSSGLQHPESSIYIGRSAMSGSDPAGGEDAIENEVVIGYNTVGNGSDTITLGNTSITDFHCEVRLTVDSDIRIKRDILESELGLDFIEQLQPITFKKKNPFDYPEEIRDPQYSDRDVDELGLDRKMGKKHVAAEKRPADNENVQIGLSAQDLEAVLTAQNIDIDMVKTNNRGKKGIEYAALIMPLIKSIQTLSARVRALEAN